MRILLCGCGSMGATAALNIARRYGDKVSFMAVDRERVEHENLANQPWLDSFIGMTKVNALSVVLYRTARVDVVPCKFELKSPTIFVKRYKPEVDFIIDAFDNVPSRLVTVKLAEMLGVPVLHAGFTESTAIVTWENIYKETNIEREPICDRRELGTVVRIGAALCEKAATEYILNKNYVGFILTIFETDVIINKL